MNRALQVYLFIVLSFSLGVRVSAQSLTANFIMSDSVGCNPTTVIFTNTSTGSPTSYSWSFGDGGSSVSTNPGHVYNTSGTFTITLTATKNGVSVTKTKTLIIHPSPNVAFTGTPLAGCPPLTVNFTDNSNPLVPGPATYNWNFGDGSSLSTQNPSHIFGQSGTYNITLTVTSSAGCDSSLVKQAYVLVYTPPVGDFSFTPICVAPGNTTFTSSVTGTGPYTYSWDYGDNTPFGSGSTPSHTYTTAGTYNVKMIVTDAHGCKDTVIKPLSVGALNANFNAADTVCLNSNVLFLNTSTAASSYIWNYGDNTGTTSGQNGTHTYTTPGTYNVKLQVVDAAGVCVDTFVKPITVVPGPTADFTISPPIPCPASDTLFFTNLSTNATSYQWNFGDGSPTSAAVNPYHIYNFDSLYFIKLTAVDARGCTSSKILQDTFIRLAIEIHLPERYDHCVPATLDFNYVDGPFNNGFLSSILPQPWPPPHWFYPQPPPVSITSVIWNFGDNSPTSTSNTPSHTYSSPGMYIVTLTAFTSNGCMITDTAIVHTDTIPHALFTVSDDTLCVGDTLFITDLSTGTTSATYHLSETLSFPDEASGNTYPFARVCPIVIEEPGLYYILMRAYNNSCPDTFLLPYQIFVKGPTSRFTYRVSCDTPTFVSFFDNSINRISSRLWDFGDGVTDTSKNPTHNYAGLGLKTITLTVHDDSTGCTHVREKKIKLYTPTAQFWANDTAICQHDTIFFSRQFSDSVQYYGYTISPNTWARDTTPRQGWVFFNADLYTVKLIFQDNNECWDSVTKTNYILVADPDPNFIAVPPIGCSPLKTHFIETGGNTPGAYSTQWEWTFGDNSNAIINKDTITHIYAPGMYSVKVVVTDNVGCVDSLERPNYIESRKVTAKFAASDTTLCLNQEIKFFNTSTSSTNAPLTYLWDFGDGSSTSSIDTPHHVYLQPGAYTVKLIVTDNIGCADTLIKNAYIKLAQPSADFDMSDSFALCPPLIVQFTNNSTGAINYNWSFGNGDSSIISNPNNVYATPGFYTVRLIAINSYGCRDTVYDSVRVLGYGGGLTYAPLKGCNPLTVNFTANLTGVTNFLWDFSDGTLQAANGNSTTYTYTVPGAYLPKIVFSDSSGCVNSSSGLDTIKVDDIIADFATSPACINTPITFTDTSFTYFSPLFSRTWDINNGQTTGNQKNIITTFSSPGTYPVTLISQNANGCRDTVYGNITVYDLPTIVASPDTIICVGDAASLSASGGASYAWTPTAGLSCATCQTTTASPSVATSYVVLGTDNNGCVNKDTVKVLLQTHTTSVASDGGEICKDSSIQLFASGATSYHWIPSDGLDHDDIANPIASPDVTTNYIVIAVEGSCEPDTNKVRVVVHPLPTVNAGSDEIIVAGNNVNLNAVGTLIVSYEWSPSQSLSCADCAGPIASPTATTTYVVKVTSSYGCIARDAVTVNVLCDQSQVFIPNTFSPNGDGENDVFYPRGIGLRTVESFRVYDRWGEIVYERKNFPLNDKANGWNGTYKGKTLGPDVYVYVLEGICDGGEKMVWKGDINLLR